VVVVVAVAVGACKDCPPCPQCPAKSEAEVVYAGSSAECGDDKVTVSTGTNEGKCSYGEGADGKVQTLNCDDSKGNSASMTCKNGVLLCSSTGAGKCEYVR
jgi:hypothetical protein